MTVSGQQLQDWLHAREDEHLEFKEAKNNFHFEKLVKYCAALANEGGGSIVLGVNDTVPRKVVGSQVFTDLERTKAGLIEKLRFGVTKQLFRLCVGEDDLASFTHHQHGADLAKQRQRDQHGNHSRNLAAPEPERHHMPDLFDTG